MKLYYSPGACSQAVHIVLCELGLPHDLVQVDLATHQLVDGGDYLDINPNGYVPALALEDGQVLTEVPAILCYLAEQRPDAGLLPPAGSLERARVMQWLAFVGTEVHRNLGMLFNPAAAELCKDLARRQLQRRLAWVADWLEQHEWPVGEGPTLADAYLYVVLGWPANLNVDTSSWPSLERNRQHLAGRPAVPLALVAEGLTARCLPGAPPGGRGAEENGPQRSPAASSRTSSAWAPLSPSTTMKLTCWPSLRPRRPCSRMARKCTNTSLPSSRVMKPNPLLVLNHLTWPLSR